MPHHDMRPTPRCVLWGKDPPQAPPEKASQMAPGPAASVIVAYLPPGTHERGDFPAGTQSLGCFLRSVHRYAHAQTPSHTHSHACGHMHSHMITCTHDHSCARGHTHDCTPAVTHNHRHSHVHGHMHTHDHTPALAQSHIHMFTSGRQLGPQGGSATGPCTGCTGVIQLPPAPSWGPCPPKLGPSLCLPVGIPHSPAPGSAQRPPGPAFLPLRTHGPDSAIPLGQPPYPSDCLASL